MTTETYTLPLVGDYFRPPAKAIIQNLPAETPLYLEREPENPYDENAVKVLVLTEDIPIENHESLEASSAPFGYSLEEILAEPSWHLGYVAKEFAVFLSPLLISSENYSAHLIFQYNAKNFLKPFIELTFETEE